MKVKCPNCLNTYGVDLTKADEYSVKDLKCPSCGATIPLHRNESASSDITQKKQAFLAKAKALPPIPDVLIKSQKIINSENGDLKDLADILEKDQAMASRILKIANSAYYALKNPVHTVKEACVMLGSDTLLQMITLASTSKLLGKELKGYCISAGEVFMHSVGVGFAARLIALEVNEALAPDAFSAGILHDAGKLILNEYLSEDKDNFVSMVSSGISVFTAEKKIFGFDHAEIGYEFLKNWNIPQEQYNAVRWHHHPEKSKEILPYIIHLADALIRLLDEEDINENLIIEKDALEHLKLDLNFLSDVQQKTRVIIEQVFMGFID